MNLRTLCTIAAAGAFALSGCKTPYKESDKKREEKKKDASGDQSFQAVVGRLRIAVRNQDFQELAQLMTADFGYRWDAPPSGETPFSYWQANNVWPELNRVLEQKFVPHDDFMVAPPEFAADSLNYPGYRAGMKQVNGSWKFAYFVGAPPAAEQAVGQ